MPVYISQMVPYFSLFDTFMDQTLDSGRGAGLGAASPRKLERSIHILLLVPMMQCCRRSIGFTIGFHNHGEGPYPG